MLIRNRPLFLMDGEGGGGGPVPPTPPADPVVPPAPQPPAPQDPPKPEPDNAAFAEMRRQKEQAEREAKAAKDALAERERKEAEEAGQFKDLYEQQKAENDALKQATLEAEQKGQAQQYATAKGFSDPSYVQYLLEGQKVDFSDAAAVQAAIDKLATNRTDLIGTAPPTPPTGGPAGGSNPDPPQVTAAQIREMTPAQVKALPPEVLAKALASPTG